MKHLSLLILLLAPIFCTAQFDSSLIKKIKALDTANVLRNDTVAVPDDSYTRKIRQLLSEKNGLSIETILRIKIMEDQQKDTSHSREFYNRLMSEITTGPTAKLIDNCLVNIYRRTFTESEIDDLVAFYKTSAGKKMDREFLVLLVESAKGAEQLLKIAAKKIEKK